MVITGVSRTASVSSRLQLVQQAGASSCDASRQNAVKQQTQADHTSVAVGVLTEKNCGPNSFSSSTVFRVHSVVGGKFLWRSPFIDL